MDDTRSKFILNNSPAKAQIFCIKLNWSSIKVKPFMNMPHKQDIKHLPRTFLSFFTYRYTKIVRI